MTGCGMRLKISSGRPSLRCAGEKDNIFWALKDMSLKVREGEVLGLNGHNGAGTHKTESL